MYKEAKKVPILFLLRIEKLNKMSHNRAHVVGINTHFAKNAIMHHLNLHSDLEQFVRSNDLER